MKGVFLFTKTFKGGLHPPENKVMTSAKPVEEAPLPSEVVVHLHQHTGAPCVSLVEKGEKVLAGQKIGDSDAFISAPVHSPVSGEVIAVEPRFHFTGVRLMCVVIAPDEKQKQAKLKVPTGKSLTPEQVRTLVREAGIVGLGGAAFPTHVKLSPPKDKPIDAVIINGCECEPYLTCDHRNMLEQADKLIDGIKLILFTVGAEKAYIAVEDNKPDAIAFLQDKVSTENVIQVVALPTKYPQGAEKQLIKAILNREVPCRCLPSEVGALVQNVGTTIAISEAVREGRPLTERVITLSGTGIAEPKNLRVKIGTPLNFLVEQCGGFRGEVEKIIMGGPMTGCAQFHLETPTVKGTSGILALTRQDPLSLSDSYGSCIRCGRCVSVCPMILMPSYLGVYSQIKMWDMTEKYNALDCIECGCCGYVCPSRIPLVQLIRLAKAKVIAKQQAKK